MPKTTLFITDLDGTLTGDQAALNQFKHFLDGFDRRPQLVYVTGRHVQSAQHLIRDDELPRPDVLVTDIGTAIYTGTPPREDLEWQRMMQKDWCSEAIIQIGVKIAGLTQQDLPDTKRVSFFARDSGSVETLEEQLKKHQLAHKLIYSADRYVDVLPRASGKGRAVSYVLAKYFDQKASVLVAGDSGNDAEMLELGYPSVIVGNGHPELRYLHKQPTVYQASQTHAAGIQEGWQYFYS